MTNTQKELVKPGLERHPYAIFSSTPHSSLTKSSLWSAALTSRDIDDSGKCAILRPTTVMQCNGSIDHVQLYL
jgi:hypothetical protein